MKNRVTENDADADKLICLGTNHQPTLCARQREHAYMYLKR